MAKKNITLNQLAEKMDKGFTAADKRTDDLGFMVKEGFDAVDKRFDAVDKDIKEIKGDIKELKQGQENIELKLSNVAYRFELEEVKQRVMVLEQKLNAKK